ENLWNNIVVSNNIAAQNNPRVSTEENGGVYVVWEDSRTEGNNIDIYAQHFDSDGIEIWETSGRAISAQLGDQKGNLGKVVDGNLLINWSDKRNGSVGLYFQIINNDGETILEEDGEQIFWGLSGNSEYLRTVRANDGLYFIWTDTRNGYLGSKIYVQKIDEEGNIYFDNNGILVCELFPGATQSDFFAIAHHDNGIVVSWSEQRETYPYVYYQHIDQEGNLFDNDGFMLTPEPVRDQSNSKIVRSGEDYYFYWEDMGDDWFACIYGQKIVNGERQWGDRGAPILLAEDNDIFLFDVVENYIIFTNDITQLGEIFVKAIDENGNALPGFPESGLEVCINNYPQSKAKGKIINGNLFVVWEDQRNGDSDIYGQIVTPQGDILWDENGIPLIDGVGDQVDVDFMDNEDMTIAWLDRSTGYADVGINKFDNDGLPMWAETFAVVKDSTQKAIDLKKIGSTSMIVYEDHIGADSNIYMQFVNNAGEIISDPYSESGLPLCSAPKNQYTPQVVNVDDNSAIVGWIDGRASGKEEIKGVFAQKVNIDENDTEDDYIPSPQSKLSNYPNPFNPTTNIYFSIDQEENVKLEVFNIKGQKINQLVNNQLSAGQHSIVWNGTDDSGKSVSSGVFFYKLTTESKSTINKMLMLK
ncbi:MAG: T9SS type A sorting domain-containing protein, partial [Candidatus Cloacimonadota bacterium]|nr:T9SS type A sorting domain-containing protein [Candidatus Cloacimonadota bacterium]